MDRDTPPPSQLLPQPPVSIVWAAGTGGYGVRLTDDMAHQWMADEPLYAGGDNTGPSPDRLLLSSLGACTVITLRMYAGHKRWSLSGVRVKLEFNLHGKPGAGVEIRRHISLEGDLDAKQRERLLQIAEACPIHRVLTQGVRITTTAAEPSRTTEPAS